VNLGEIKKGSGWLKKKIYFEKKIKNVVKTREAFADIIDTNALIFHVQRIRTRADLM
jgi:hypothetical protein